jgi:tetratricopeptide (TPR) repeat protein
MPRALHLASLLAVVAGCQSVSPEPEKSAPPAPTPAVTQAAAFVRVPTKPADERPAEPAPDALSLAADCLDRGDDAGAVNHLEKHVGQHPDHVLFRAQLADLLARLDRLPEAQGHYETATAHAQDGPAAVRKHLVRYHTRLMEIARQRDDTYAEHLHRGIGLYLVAGRIEDGAESDDVERLLCKAATALKEAQSLRPDDARSAYYLYRVWLKLDQPRPAEKALRQALAAAPFSRLTPTEARELALVGKPTEAVPK